jgi:RNA polymerase sigma-70 factor (ECF subfamily)
MSAEGQRLLSQCEALLSRSYEESGAKERGVSREVFASALGRSVEKRFGCGAASTLQVEEYLATLHLEDLALACACAEGMDAAWEEFVGTYRGYLRIASAAILRRPAGAAEAVEMADSLFAELYGLADGRRGERSLFRYFHGRSSLKTWLRAVLAQRQVDAVRAGRKFESLDGPDGETRGVGKDAPAKPPAVDPDRELYLKLFQAALKNALGRLAQQDLERLRLYYANEETLAEIGRRLGEHESSVSRNLERIRRELRQQVEELLRRGEIRADGAARRALSEAQIALCFEFATGETPIDLENLFGGKPQGGKLPEKQQS